MGSYSFTPFGRRRAVWTAIWSFDSTKRFSTSRILCQRSSVLGPAVSGWNIRWNLFAQAPLAITRVLTRIATLEAHSE